MMLREKFRRLATACAVPVIAVSVLSGCFSILPQSEASKPEKQVEAPVEKQEQKKPQEGIAAGTLLAPGEQVQGAPGSVPWKSFDGSESVWTHQVVSIELAPSADMSVMLESVPRLVDYDVYYVVVHSSYVSGEVTPFASFQTEFQGVRADGMQLQDVSLAGYENCPANTPGAEPEDPNTVIENCVAVSSPKGSAAPDGVAWAQFDTGYDKYQGSPALILL